MKSCQVLSKWEGFFSGNHNAMLWLHFHNTLGVGGWSLCLDRLEGYLTFCSGETQPRFKSRPNHETHWHQPQLLLGSCAFIWTKPPRTCPCGKNEAKSSTPQNFSMWYLRKLMLKSNIWIFFSKSNESGYHFSCNLKKPNRERIEWWLLGRGRWGERGDAGLRVQTSSCKSNRFWGSNVQHGDYSS